MRGTHHSRSPWRALGTGLLSLSAVLLLLAVALLPATAGEDRVDRRTYDRLTEQERRDLEQSLEESLAHLDGLGEEISHLVTSVLADLEIHGSDGEILIRGLPRGDELELHAEELERHMEIFGERLEERMSRLAEDLSERFDRYDRYDRYDRHHRGDRRHDEEATVAELERRIARLQEELRELERELEERDW